MSRAGTHTLYLVVAAGTMLGGLARWSVSGFFYLLLETGFPWGTLLVNATGSLLIGFYATLSAPDGRLLASPLQRHFVMTGFCGGYTTFSIFSLETLQLIQAGQSGLAGAYAGLSVVTWLLAVWAGFVLAARINRLERSTDENP